MPLALTSSLDYDTYKQVCYGNVIFTYMGPSILHFVGFLYALYLFRISDNEQLQNLMERVSKMILFDKYGLTTVLHDCVGRFVFFFRCSCFHRTLHRECQQANQRDFYACCGSLYYSAFCGCVYLCVLLILCWQKEILFSGGWNPGELSDLRVRVTHAHTYIV